MADEQPSINAVAAPRRRRKGPTPLQWEYNLKFIREKYWDEELSASEVAKQLSDRLSDDLNLVEVTEQMVKKKVKGMGLITYGRNNKCLPQHYYVGALCGVGVGLKHENGSPFDAEQTKLASRRLRNLRKSPGRDDLRESFKMIDDGFKNLSLTEKIFRHNSQCSTNGALSRNSSKASSSNTHGRSMATCQFKPFISCKCDHGTKAYYRPEDQSLCLNAGEMPWRTSSDENDSEDEGNLSRYADDADVTHEELDHTRVPKSENDIEPEFLAAIEHEQKIKQALEQRFPNEKFNISITGWCQRDNWGDVRMECRRCPGSAIPVLVTILEGIDENAGKICLWQVSTKNFGDDMWEKHLQLPVHQSKITEGSVQASRPSPSPEAVEHKTAKVKLWQSLVEPRGSIIIEKDQDGAPHLRRHRHIPSTSSMSTNLTSRSISDYSFRQSLEDERYNTSTPLTTYTETPTSSVNLAELDSASLEYSDPVEPEQQNDVMPTLEEEEEEEQVGSRDSLPSRPKYAEEPSPYVTLADVERGNHADYSLTSYVTPTDLQNASRINSLPNRIRECESNQGSQKRPGSPFSFSALMRNMARPKTQDPPQPATTAPPSTPSPRPKQQRLKKRPGRRPS